MRRLLVNRDISSVLVVAKTGRMVYNLSIPEWKLYGVVHIKLGYLYIC